MDSPQLRIARAFFEEGFNKGRFDAADAQVAADVVDHSTMPAPAPGREGMKLRILGLRQAFPDVRITFDGALEQGDQVAFRWSMAGTDTGGFMGRPPTGRGFRITGVNIERFAGGRIVEHWSWPDLVALLKQLGVIP